jgi:hypothetical protein
MSTSTRCDAQYATLDCKAGPVKKTFRRKILKGHLIDCSAPAVSAAGSTCGSALLLLLMLLLMLLLLPAAPQYSLTMSAKKPKLVSLNLNAHSGDLALKSKCCN